MMIQKKSVYIMTILAILSGVGMMRADDGYLKKYFGYIENENQSSCIGAYKFKIKTEFLKESLELGEIFVDPKKQDICSLLFYIAGKNLGFVSKDAAGILNKRLVTIPHCGEISIRNLLNAGVEAGIAVWFKSTPGYYGKKSSSSNKLEVGYRQQVVIGGFAAARALVTNHVMQPHLQTIINKASNKIGWGDRHALIAAYASRVGYDATLGFLASLVAPIIGG